MEKMSTAMRTADINVEIRRRYDPSDQNTLAAMGTIALHRLRNQFPAARLPVVVTGRDRHLAGPEPGPAET